MPHATYKDHESILEELLPEGATVRVELKNGEFVEAPLGPELVRSLGKALKNLRHRK